MADVAAVVAAPFVAHLIRDIDTLAIDPFQGIGPYALVTAATSLFFLSYFRVGGILGEYLCTADIRRICKAAAIGVLAGVVLMFTFNRLDQVPRSVPVLHILVLTASLIGGRLAWARLKRTGPRPAPRVAEDAAESVLLIGVNAMTLLYLRMVATLDSRRPRIVALLDDDRKLHGRAVAGHQVVGGWSSLDQIVSEYASHGVHVDRAIVMTTDPGESHRISAAIAPTCSGLGIHLDLWADHVRRISCPVPAGLEVPTEPMAVPGLEVHNPIYWRFRRSVDVVVSLAALVILSPLVALTAAIVALDVGLPVIFWQYRLGQHGRRFRVYKFRTLRPPFSRRDVALSDEERLSRVGRWLRATRLDELPQLLNILLGDMTIVGPRPLLPIDQPLTDQGRLAVRPGLTGWAQVNGGKLITPAEKNMLDKWYVRNCGPLLDLRIVALTFVSVVRGDSRERYAARIGASDRDLRM